MQFRKGYKYQLSGSWGFTTEFPFTANNEYIRVYPTGIIIHDGYAWDGTSGPVIDTPRNLRASLVHDALYQLMREGRVDHKYKDFADRLFMSICIEDGTPKWKASLYYKALRSFGGHAADPKNDRKVYEVVGGKTREAKPR